MMQLNSLMEESEKPKSEFSFDGDDFATWGNIKGHYKTSDYDVGKFNRYAKIGHMADELYNRFQDICDKDPASEDGRCAYACLLMMNHGVRVGNEDSAEGYESGLEDNKGEMVQTFGVTTLKKEHIKFRDGDLILDFLGKEQVEQYIVIENDFLIRHGLLYLKKATDKWLGLDYEDIISFIKKHIGQQFSPKDLRTFCANASCWRFMQPHLKDDEVMTKKDAKALLADIVEQTADRLGNTPSVCRSNYLDSRMLDWFVDQKTGEDTI